MADASKKLRVLVSAYACEPGKGSEPGLGWNIISHLGKHHEVYAITAQEQRAAIEAYIAEHPHPNVHWIYPHMPAWIPSKRRLSKLIRVHYYLWQIVTYRAIKRALQNDLSVDVIHHVSYVSYWTPSFLSLLKLPFIFGPVGGGESAPRSFYKTLSFKSQFSEMLRDSVRWLEETLDPFVRRTVQRSTLVLCTTEETYDKICRLGAKNARVLPDIALPLEDISLLNALPVRQDASPFRVISVGRLIGWKAFHLGIRAFARFHAQYPNSEYWILGNGPEMETLKQLARDLNIADRVTFWGSLPRTEVLQRLEEADVLLHPSLHDSGGWVCLEGMSAGRPVVCLNLGGPAVQVTAETGFVVPAHTPESSVDGIADALHQLAESPELRLKMGENGRRRVREYFTWDYKVGRFSAAYHEILGLEPWDDLVANKDTAES